MSAHRRSAPKLAYQACVPPQRGQSTVVDTSAWNLHPHGHEYSAWSSD